MKPLTSSSSFALRVVVSLGLVALSSGSFLSSVAGQDDQHKIDIRLKGLPKQNRAVYLGWQGKIDTKISFSQFFDSDHTVMAWFMPQYPHCYEGPIFAENGSGNYIVGQGHYRDGDGGYKDKGNPVFFIQVGDRKVIYLVPEFKENSWVHVAVVRLNNKFKLYLNGTHKTPVKMPNKAECQKISNLIAALKKEKDSLSLDLKEAAPGQKPQIVSQINALNAKITAKENELEQCLTPNPDDEIEVSANFDSKPYGTLRFGRRTTGNSDSKRDWQAYGLLDDVAVFSRALSSAEINAVRDRKRLTGTEHGLIAGWCFDKPAPDDRPLPPQVDSWKVSSARAHIMPVTSDRNTSLDSQQFNNPLIVGETNVALTLPIKVNEVWYVVQGYDAPGGSHNGNAAFSYDFKLNEPKGTHNEYPKESANAPVLASCDGKALVYLKDGPVEGGRETNFVTVKIAEGEFIRYLHLAANSLPDGVSGGNDERDFSVIQESEAPTIKKGSRVGKVGPKAYHVHWAGKNTSLSGVTIPMAFENYEASNDGGANWAHVFRGHPKTGQLIKRFQ